MISEKLSPMDRFEAVCADPYGLARAAAAQGHRIAGYMNSQAPEELLHAGGYFPVRTFGFTDGTQLADGLLQSYACTVARGALNLMLSGGVDFLDVMVFPHTCDTVQNLTDIWKRNTDQMRVFALSMPVCMTGESAVRFLCEEFGRLRGFLEEECGAITDDAIRASMELYERHRAAMRRLYVLRRTNPGCISAADVLKVVLASCLMRKEDHLPLLEALVQDVEAREPAQADARPRVFVAGTVVQRPEYLAAIEHAGCVVVDDELCTGSRAFNFEPVGCDDPLESLARMYLARPPSPSKHRPGFHAGRYLVGRAQAAAADGLIFLLTKFCDPWAFDYPHARETLDAAGLPSLLLEIEQQPPPSGQFETRVAAFAEMLCANRKEHE